MSRYGAAGHGASGRGVVVEWRPWDVTGISGEQSMRVGELELFVSSSEAGLWTWEVHAATKGRQHRVLGGAEPSESLAQREAVRAAREFCDLFLGAARLMAAAPAEEEARSR